MCLIIHRSAPAPIPADHVANALAVNPDGWGIMLAHSGRIVTSRGLRAKSLRKALARIGDTPCTIHFRYATHGTIDTDNCHPFEILGGRFAVMHNGVIDTVPIVDKARSDTWHWANHVLAPRLQTDPAWFDRPTFSDDVINLAPGWNKLVILRADGVARIAGASRGMTSADGAFWYSNDGHLGKRPAWKGWARKATRELVELDPIRTGAYPDTSRQGGWDLDIDTPRFDRDEIRTLEDLAFLDWRDREDFIREHPEFVSELIEHMYA